MSLIQLEFAAEDIATRRSSEFASAFLYVNAEYINDPERHPHHQYTEKVFLMSEERYLELESATKDYKQKMFANEEDEQMLSMNINLIVGRPYQEREVLFSHGKVSSDSESALDVTKLIEKLTAGDKKHLILLVESSSSCSNNSLPVNCLQVTSPILFVLLKQRVNEDDKIVNLINTLRSRSRRNALPGSEGKEHSSLLDEDDEIDDSHKDDDDDDDIYRSIICQKVPFIIDFEDLGWNNWLLSPQTLNLYRCEGSCPFPLGGDLNGTNYSLLTSMMSSTESDNSNSPSPCCVPVTYRPMSLLYLDRFNNVVLQQYTDMVIEGCGCR